MLPACIGLSRARSESSSGVSGRSQNAKLLAASLAGFRFASCWIAFHRLALAVQDVINLFCELLLGPQIDRAAVPRPPRTIHLLGKGLVQQSTLRPLAIVHDSLHWRLGADDYI